MALTYGVAKLTFDTTAATIVQSVAVMGDRPLAGIMSYFKLPAYSVKSC